MTTNKNMLLEIREYETARAIDLNMNQRALPQLLTLIVEIESSDFGKEDLDLKERIVTLQERLLTLTPETLTQEFLDEARLVTSGVVNELKERYRVRMNLTSGENLLNKIREFEATREVDKRTNGRVLPELKALLYDIDSYKFSDEDSDLKLRLADLRDIVNTFNEDTLTQSSLTECRSQAATILMDLELRYRRRMEKHASR